MRIFWICFGLGTHGLFVFTVCRLFPFLQNTGDVDRRLLINLHLPLGWLWFNALLAAQFAVVHSWLLWPATRKRLERFIPGPQYGCFFCLATCLGLLLTIELWQPGPFLLWNLQGTAGASVRLAFLGSWAALLYSLSLTGLGYQTGWTPWWAWVNGRPPPRRTFEPRSLYRWLRHPVYLSFLGLIWLTPAASADRAALIAVWTVYIFVGSYLKDRRLLHYTGEVYRRYQARVPGYPLMPFGPLSKVPFGRTSAPIPQRSAVFLGRMEAAPPAR